MILALALPLLWLNNGYLYVPEESEFINYQNIFDKNLFSWNEKENYGQMSSPNDHTKVVPDAIFYKLLSEVGLSNHYIQIIFLQIFLFCSLLGISYLLRLFTNNNAVIFVSSLLYIFNFYFTTTIFYSAKMFQLILMPLFFIYLYKYLKTECYKYAIYNFISLFLLQAIFCNLAQLATTLLVYILAVVAFIFSEKMNSVFFLKKYISKLCIFFVLMLPIFFYQGLTWFSFLSNLEEVKSAALAIPRLFSPLIFILQLRGAWWEYGGYDGIPYNRWLFFYDNLFVILHSIIIFIISMHLLFFKKNNKYIYNIIFLLIFIFLASGSSFAPNIYLYFYRNIPFFGIFREPFSKFMPLVLFLMVISFSISFDNISEKLRNRNYKKFFMLFILFLVLIGSIPLFSYDFIDHRNEGWKKTFIKIPDYWYEYSSWSKNNKDSFILPFPFMVNIFDFNYNWYNTDLGNSNLQIYHAFGNSNYIGDPYNLFNPYSKILRIFVDKENFNFIKLGTVNYLLDQKDIDRTKIEGLFKWESGIKKYFQGNYFKNFGGKLFIYKIKNEYLLPHIYTPQSLIISSSTIDKLPDLVSTPDYQIRSAIYFRGQNKGKEKILEKMMTATSVAPEYQIPSAIYFRGQNKGNEDLLEKMTNTSVDLAGQTLEFKKINPTKYIVKVHHAKGDFPLVFSESFHNGWKMYLVKSSEIKDHSLNLEDYKILDGNSEDQASKEELIGYIKQGWVSTIGDEYKIDFVSKNFQDTIQNDNLLNGHIWDTWLKKPLEEENHLMANGYANSWWIDLKEICKNSDLCVKNPDGSYDFELIVEFLPQRLFYIGLIVSSFTLLSLIGYLIYDWKRIKKRSL